MADQNQNPIDAALNQAPAPNPIDLALFNASPTRPINGKYAIPNPIDAAIGAQSQPQGPRATEQKEPFQIGSLIPQSAIRPMQAVEKVLTQPIGKTLGLQKQTLTEAYAPQTPEAQGGTAGAASDINRIGSQAGLGLADFAQSPAGLASAFLIAVTGGAAAPWLASGFAAGQAPEAMDAYREYKANPTPENLQRFLTKTAMVPAMAAGAKGGEIGKLSKTRIPPELAEKIPALRQGEGAPTETTTTLAAQPTDAAVATARAQAAGMPAEVTARIQQNAEALKPIVEPARVESRGDVQTQLDQAASVLTRNPDPRMQEPLKFPEQQRLAQNLGMTPGQLLSTPSGQAFSAEQVVAANSMLEASRTQVMKLARLAATGDEAYGQQFLTALARHQEIQDVVTGRVSAEAGRALGAFRNQPTEGTIAAAVDALSKLPKDAQLTAAQQLAKLDPNDAGAVAKFTREITPSSTMGKIYEAWMNGILSGGTGIVKATSDVAMRSLGAISRPVSAAFDAVHSALTGQPRTRYLGDTKADLYGMLRGMPKALSQFADTFFHEQSMGEQVMDMGARTSAVKGPLGFAVRTPTRFLEAVTDAAKIVNFSADIHAQAYRAARAEGLTGDAAWTRAEELANSPTPEMRANAGQYALQQTFQQKLGPIGQAVTKLRDAVPGGRFLLPFIKTPANILKSAGEYSPLGFIGTAAKAAKGGLEGGPLADSLAKNSLGTALTAAVLYHALEGNITGGGPANPKDRNRLQAAGWQPYSVKVGNRYVSYRKIEPLGTVMSAAADVAEAMKRGAAGLGTGGLATSLMQKISRNMEQAEFIGSIMRLNQIFEGPGRYARGLLGTVIPTGVANIAKAQDRIIRAPKTALEQLQSRIPGLTQNVPPVTTPEGRPLQRPVSALGGFNPYPVSTGQPGLSALEATLARKQEIQDAKQARRQTIKQRVGQRRAVPQ